MNNPDTPENRMYIQRNRLWLLGEVVVMKLMKDKPEDPVAAALSVLENERMKPTDSVEPPTPEDAAEAKEYLQKHSIGALIEAWFQATLEAKPESAIEFAIAHFKKSGQKSNGAIDGSAATGGAEEERKPATPAPAEVDDEALADAL